MTEDTIQAVEKALSKADPLLGNLISTQTLTLPEPRSDYFASLARSIIGQQVSVAAAKAIALRFAEQTSMDPVKAATLTEDNIKAIGLSRQKASYIRDLARHFVDNPAIYGHLDKKSDAEVITELTAIRGIGAWTAQMFLMFTLLRPDAFAPDDVGLQRAMMQLYGWQALPPKKELTAKTSIWSPYRTVASFHLWQSLDSQPA